MSEWLMTYQGYDPRAEGLREALCTLGNGYVGTRGAAPESSADDVHYPGTYFAGVFNRLQSEVDGLTLENEDMVNAPNWLPLSFRPQDGEWLNLDRMEVIDYRQELEIRRGVLTRLLSVRDGDGRETRVAERRFVHMGDPHYAGIEMTVQPLNWSGPMEVRAALDGRVVNGNVERYQGLANDHLDHLDARGLGDDGIALEVVTNQSRIGIAEAARVTVRREGTPEPLTWDVSAEPRCVEQRTVLEAREGETLVIQKVAALAHSRDVAISTPGEAVERLITTAPEFDTLLEQHVLAWDHLWDRVLLQVEDDEWAPRVLNLHVFHLMQVASPHLVDRDVGIPARGLHGEAYRGHIFWDELFIFPFLTYRLPELTDELLMYRYRRLPEARRRAREQGHEGAVYPWQSGSSGREESQRWHLNPRSGRWIPDHSSLQRHINIAVAWNVWSYFQITDDRDFMAAYGAEMLIEMARYWASVAQYSHARDRYEIRRVMGPDEFHDAYPDAEEPGLDNNAYTNVMAAWTILRARDALDCLPDYDRTEVLERLSLLREETERWDEITHKMFVPFHDGDIISQFEGYEDLLEFDWEGYRRRYDDIHRLDRLLEAEGDSVNRYKASKQADVLMLLYLLSNEELEALLRRMGYDWESSTAIPRNVDYYLQRTSHGSTLSRLVHSWVLARSDRERSTRLFRQALASDVEDVQGGTTPEGIHLGAMAGTVDLVQRGYAGLEAREDQLWLNPALPEGLASLRFPLRYRGVWLDLEVTRGVLTLAARPGPGAPVRVRLSDARFELRTGDRIEVHLD